MKPFCFQASKHLPLSNWTLWLLLLSLSLGLYGIFPMAALGQSVAPGAHLRDSVQKSKPPAEENPDSERAKLEQRLADARIALANAQSLYAHAEPEQIGATNEEIREKLRLHTRLVFALGQHLGALEFLERARFSAKDLDEKMSSWQGFGAPPPYPLDMVDGLRDEMQTQNLAIRRNLSKKKLILQEIDEARETLREAEKKLRQQQESLENAKAGAEKTRYSWLFELTKVQKEVAEHNLLSAQSSLKALEEDSASQQKKLDFVERQFQAAFAEVAFTQQELDRKLEEVDGKIKALEQESLAAEREDRRNQELLRQSRERLELVRQSLATSPSGAEGEVAFHLLQEEVEVRRAWADTSGKMNEIQQTIAGAFSGERLIWLERFRLHQGRDENALQRAAQKLLLINQKLADYRQHLQTSYDLAQTLAAAEQQRLDQGHPTEDERRWAEQKHLAYATRSDFYARSLEQLNGLSRLAERFQDEISDLRRQVTLTERLKAFGEDFLELHERFWNYELVSVEDTIFVDGQKVTELRPVTVSKVVRALLILVIGSWIAVRLKQRLRQGLARLFTIEAGEAATISRLVIAIAIFCLAAVAMTIVRIPLTVFTFFGGALAIGVGFGAQAIINNFISGIILMFERPIRVGDLVEVDGASGKITQIGLRATQVRRFDGIDILVPNSEFLQKNVINWTHTDQLLRRVVKVGVAYGSPTREVAKIIGKALDEHGKVLKNPEPVVLFEDFSNSVLLFSAYFWVEINEKLDTRTVDSDLRHMLDKRFREAGITIAFPQLDVHIEQAQPVPLQLEPKTRQESKGAAKIKAQGGEIARPQDRAEEKPVMKNGETTHAP